MSLRTVFLIAAKEWRDAGRNRWFVVVATLFATLATGLSLLGMAGLGSLGIAGFGRTAASLLNLVLLIVPLMGLLLGAMSLPTEREQGTLALLLAQPVTAAEVYLGKYCGSAAALGGALLVGFGLSGLVVSLRAGAEHLSDYAALVALTAFLGLACLSVGFLLSVFMRRSATAVGGALFVWFALLVFSDLALMGSAIVLEFSPQELFWLVAANPVQAFKLAASGTLQRSLEAFGAAGAYAAETFGSGFIWVLGGVIFLWVALPLGAGLLIFSRRCAE